VRWSIRHRTTFRSDDPVENVFNEVRLQPANNGEQTRESFYLTVRPEAVMEQYLDFYGNGVSNFNVFAPHYVLEILAESIVTTHPGLPLAEDRQTSPLATIREMGRNAQCFDFIQASRFTDTDPLTSQLALEATAGQTDVWQASVAMMRFVRQRLVYETNSTHVHTPMRDVLAQGRGVCQDFAHVMIGLCRSLGIPARYVSGYLATQNASATHAWTEMFIPTLGWRGLDPTHGCQPNDSYIKIATGRDYNDVPPVRGTYTGSPVRRMEVEVQITPAAWI
jgi:transglutaminase-like putative cysteine protease